MFDDFSLTKREHDVMEILWATPRSMTIAEISQMGLTKSTVMAALSKLVDMDFVTIDKIGYSGRVLCRYFKANISKELYEQQKFVNTLEKSDIPASRFFAALLGRKQNPEQAMKELNELEKMLNEKKQELLNLEKQDKQQET